MNEFVGVLHVHSTYSDGTGRVGEILDAARQAGLDFVVLSDHDCLAARREGWEKRYRPPEADKTGRAVTLVVAAEITPDGAGHCLALGISQCCGFARLPENRYLDAIKTGGGFAIVAHPLGKVKRSLGILQRPWRLWHHPAIAGLELWSYMHDWIDTLHAWRLREFYQAWRYPRQRIVGPAPELVALWDRLCQTRRYAIVPGTDCHARHIPVAGWVVFPYVEMFRVLRLHLFLENAEPRPHEILAGIREGRGYIGYDFVHDSAGARFEGACACGKRLWLGGEHAWHGPVSLTFRAPTEARLRLLLNGGEVASGQGTALDYVADVPGVYRAEARLDGRPWIITNPIYLRAGEEAGDTGA